MNQGQPAEPARETGVTCEVCGFEAQATDGLEPNYCERCGWSLGKLAVELVPSTLTLAGDRPEALSLRCRNSGWGHLKCTLGELPHGVSLAVGATREWTLGPHPHDVTVLVDPKTVDSAARTLPLSIWANDKRGVFTHDYRPPAPETALQEHPLAVPFQRRRLGPVHYFQELLLFQRRQRQQPWKLQNRGDVDLAVEIEVTGGYQVRRPGELPQTRLVVKLLGQNHTEELLIDAPEQGGTGTLTARVADLPHFDRDVLLCWIGEETIAENPHAWIIGIDFGTAKTAVFVTDCRVPGSPPAPVEWPSPAGPKRLKVPSAIEYVRNRVMPNFGWEVSPTAELDVRNTVIRSIKKRLIEDVRYRLPDGREVNAQDVVTDYIRFILSHVRQQPMFQRRDPFPQAQIVLGLPVRDQDEQFHEQERRTKMAAQAAGLRPEQLVCFPEPECAAVDFLCRQSEMGMTVQDGDLLCVFDGGAGTTDICILEVRLGQEASFVRRALAGFPIAGDVVDELLARHFLSRWKDEGVLEEVAADLSTFRIKGDATPRSYMQLLMQLRQLKEQLVFPDPDQPTAGPQSVQFVYGRTPDEAVEISWNLIDELYGPYAQKMVETGFQPEDVVPDWRKDQPGGRALGQALPSLRDVLWQNHIEPMNIRWLCLTGGTSFIPIQVALLQHLLQVATLIPPRTRLSELSRQSDSPLTLNVAQGAARRPQFRISGQLQADYALRLVTGQTSLEQAALARGDAPGKVAQETSFTLPPLCEANLQVVARVGTVSGVVYSQPVKNRDEVSTAMVLPTLEYGADQRLYLAIDIGAGGRRLGAMDRAVIV